MQTYHDDYIRDWGLEYIKSELHRYVTFEEFLRAPHLTLARIESGEYRPLLAEQRQLAEELIDTEHLIARAAQGLTTAEDAEHLERLVRCARGIVDVPRRDGRAVEKLRHHCWPKRSYSAYFHAREEV